MKKIYLIIISILLAVSVTKAEMPGDTESLTPSDANVFVKTKQIVKLLKTMNYIVFNLMDEKDKNEFITERKKFMDKTGIDYTDEKSLRNAGIDTNKPVSFANFDKDNPNNKTGEVMMIFLPIINEKEFPLKFIEIVKKANADKPEINISPVTTSYKDITVYQLKDDLYIASLNGYLLISSTSDIIKRVIDIRFSRTNSLILDENYKDYLAKEKNFYDINAYITKKFFEQMNTSSGKDHDKQGLFSIKNLILAQAGEGTVKSEDLNKSSFIDSIDYIAAGIGFDNNKFQLNAAVRLTKDNPYVELLLGLLKTGVHDKSLYISTADTATFISFNLKYLDNLCRGDVKWCEQYNSFKQSLKTETGIDFAKDFIPYHTGALNIMAVDSGSGGGVGDFLAFVPMTDSKKTEDLWVKIRKVFQTKYGKAKKFGEEKVSGKKAFWFIDESQMRFFVAFDGRGIYAGNSTGLMKTAINSKTVTSAKNTGRYGKVINDKTFFLLNIRKNAFLKMLMQMRAQGNPEIGKSLNRIGEIFLFCEKRDRMISIDFDIEIKEAAKKR
jgi:hypothetical protein